MEDIPASYLRARKQALDVIAENSDMYDYTIAERAIDLYMDFIETYYTEGPSSGGGK